MEVKKHQQAKFQPILDKHAKKEDVKDSEDSTLVYEIMSRWVSLIMEPYPMSVSCYLAMVLALLVGKTEHHVKNLNEFVKEVMEIGLDPHEEL